MSLPRFILALVLVVASFALVLVMLEDGFALPAWIIPYRIYFFFIWLIGATLGLIKAI